MQVGSLVELIRDLKSQPMHGEVYPVKNFIYTVRDLTNYDNDPGIRLEEITNPVRHYSEFVGECCFMVHLFRELQPPMTISIDEIVKEGNTAQMLKKVTEKFTGF